MIKNILITGGAGYIGSHVNEILIKNKKEVYIVDNLSTGHKKLINKKAKFFKLDILKTKKIKSILKKYNIDSVIHLAAALSVGESQKKPSKYKKINVQGTQNLLNAIKNTNVKNNHVYQPRIHSKKQNQSLGYSKPYSRTIRRLVRSMPVSKA